MHFEYLFHKRSWTIIRPRYADYRSIDPSLITDHAKSSSYLQVHIINVVFVSQGQEPGFIDLTRQFASHSLVATSQSLTGPSRSRLDEVDVMGVFHEVIVVI